MADANIEITAITDQAQAEIGKLSERVDGLKAGAEGLGSSGASGIDKFTGAMERVGAALVIVQSLGTIIQSLGKGINELTENGLIEADAETKAWTGSLEDLGKSLVRLDPVGVGAALGQVLGGAIVDVTDSTQTFAEVSRDAADALSYMGVQGSGAADRLRLVMQAQREWIAAQEKAAITAAIRSEAITRQIAIEQQSGSVTKAARDEVKKLLDIHERLGQDAPPSLQAVADKLGILSTSQERAADAADKAAAKLAKENEKLAEQAAQHDTLIPKLKEFADGKNAQAAATEAATKALREEVKALEENARAAEAAAGDAQKSLEDAQTRRAELEGKPVLSVEEAEELLDLQTKTSKLEADAANTAENAAQATFEYGNAQSELAGATDEAIGSVDALTQSESDLQKATEELARVTQSFGGDASEAYGAASAEFETFYDNTGAATRTFEKFGDVLLGVGRDGETVITNFGAEFGRTEDQINGAADAAKKIPTALDKIGPAAEKAGESLTGLNDALSDKEGGFGKTAAGVSEMNAELEKTHELARAIRVEFQRIGSTIGGAGAQQ